MGSIKDIQKYLIKNNYDAFVVFTNDDHGSEYVLDYFKARAYLSGFTGSAGTLLITKDASYLWTDGRYFLQASTELLKTNTKLMKMGVEGVPTIFEFIKGLAQSPKIVFDYTIATVSFVNELKASVNDVCIINEELLIDSIWDNRPKMSESKAYIIPEEATGESISSKLSRLLGKMDEYNTKYALISSLDDIAWLYNLRGDDITYNPVNYAYSLVSKDKKVLYINLKKVDLDVKNILVSNGIELKEYNEVYNDIKNINDGILIDSLKTNYKLYTLIKNIVEAKVFPTTEFKAIKNEVEINNIKKAHITDAIAMVKIIHYVKTNVGKIELSEISVSDKLEEFRRANKDCIDLSFNTICGYNSNGAIVHYSATKDTNKVLEPNGLLLIDSGGQYRYGTTDITRTLALGDITDEMRRDFTLVLKSHIAMSSMIFPKGVNGYGIDMVAREPIFKAFKDFNHGTGHGVGFMLNVHEGPQRVTMRSLNFETALPFKPGMITSDEPGLYITGKYGIRHENLVLCEKKMSNEFGEFYGFSPLTFVPFDTKAIDKSMLTKEEIDWINDYHKECYNKLNGLLDDTLKDYLKEITAAI